MSVSREGCVEFNPTQPFILSETARRQLFNPMLQDNLVLMLLGEKIE